MSTDAFAKMAEYFESLVQEMKSEARQAGLLQNPNGGWDRQRGNFPSPFGAALAR